ncbi:MAG: hypothetical protein JNK37_15960 [Verrucomicrobiales bacterium]|nr:hypothetical protein [Verrucomicrobiales bacterium]
MKSLTHLRAYSAAVICSSCGLVGAEDLAKINLGDFFDVTSVQELLVDPPAQVIKTNSGDRIARIQGDDVKIIINNIISLIAEIDRQGTLMFLSQHTNSEVIKHGPGSILIYAKTKDSFFTLKINLSSILLNNSVLFKGSDAEIVLLRRRIMELADKVPEDNLFEVEDIAYLLKLK